MAQVILIYPNLTREDDPTALLMPLSLVYVAYPLTRHGYSVRIIDQRVSPTWEFELRKELSRDETICVGISAMTGLQIEGGLLAARIVREYSPDVPIVWGGVHPSLLPQQTIEDNNVDVVVIGEGEKTFLEVVTRLETGQSLSRINGLCYRHNGKTIVTSRRAHLNLHDVDIRFLPYDLLENADQYLTNPLSHLPGAEEKSVVFLTSRGCPFRCTYCYNIRFNLGKWRAYEPETVVDHLKYVIQKFGIKGIFLIDDNFFTNPERVKRICELIVQNRINVRFYNVNCRLDIVAGADTAFLELLHKAGIHGLFIGIESASPMVLKAMRKSLDVDKVLSIDRKLQRAQIVPTYSFMIGLPVENVNDIKKTLLLMGKIVDTNPHAGISPQLYLPLPGSEMFDVCVEQGLVVPRRLSEWAYFSENYVQDLKGCCWFDEEDRNFLRRASVFMQVIDTKVNKRKTASKEFLREVYSSIVRLRIKHNFYHFMPELYLRDVKFLKLKEKKSISSVPSI